MLKSHYSGLTLIEVLIALAIVSIAMMAVIKATTENIHATAYLRDKSIATLVGLQAMNEARVGLLKLKGEENSPEQKTECLGQAWYWQASQTETPNKHISKVIIKVAKTEAELETPLINLESYVYRAKTDS